MVKFTLQTKAAAKRAKTAQRIIHTDGLVTFMYLSNCSGEVIFSRLVFLNMPLVKAIRLSKGTSPFDKCFR